MPSPEFGLYPTVTGFMKVFSERKSPEHYGRSIDLAAAWTVAGEAESPVKRSLTLFGHQVALGRTSSTLGERGWM